MIHASAARTSRQRLFARWGRRLRFLRLRSWSGLACCSLSLSLYAVAYAGTLDLQLTQYGHFAWRLQEGDFSGTPTSIAQTTDGYLWIGTDSELLKFDGVRFTQWTAWPGNVPYSFNIESLLATPDGTLWIGTRIGLARLRDGSITYVTTAQNGAPNALALGADGSIWFSRNNQHDDRNKPLCRVHPDGTTVECFGGSQGRQCMTAESVSVDRQGQVWLGCTPGFLRLSSGSFEYHAPNGITKEDEGKTWLSASLDLGNDHRLVGYDSAGKGFGLQQFSAGNWQSYDVEGFKGEDNRIASLFIDNDGALWIGTDGNGLFHVVNGKVDHFGLAEGLSGASVWSIFSDREGSIWVATSGGIDRFHRLKVTSFTQQQGMVSDSAVSVASKSDGTVVVGLIGGLNFIRPTGITSIRPGKDLPGKMVQQLLVDHKGTLWIGNDDQLGTVVENRFRPFPAPTFQVHNLIEDPQHTIWLSLKGDQYHVDGNHLTLSRPLGPDHSYTWFVPDPVDGYWQITGGGSITRYEKGSYHVLSNKQPGIHFYFSLFGPDHKLWAWGPAGLGLLKDNRWITLTSKNGLPCDVIYSVADDGAGSFWLYSRCAMVVIPYSQLEAWANDPAQTIHPSLLIKPSDGALGSMGSFPVVNARSPDGRLWFAHQTALQMVDPKHLPWNSFPPPVHIEQLIADHRPMKMSSNDISLPVRTRDLEVDYTALSLVAPKEVRFRYRLSGIDKDWQDVGSRRQAFYMNLDPGHYVFQVIACNNDGVWNQTGERLNFTIPPTFYQTLVFRYVLILLTATILWLLYLWRLHNVTVRIEERMAARLSERERIARELHDTLLQGFQAMLLRIGIVAQRFSEEEPVRQSMEGELDRAQGVLLEGRNRIKELRTSVEDAPGFLEQMNDLCEELQRDASAKISIATTGSPRRLKTFVSEELYLICKEALTNAILHSGAAEIGLSVFFENDCLKIRCGDNGKGIDPTILENGFLAGHWGMSGMKERAKQLGAEWTIKSSNDAGTEIDLRVSGTRAYAQPPESFTKRYLTALLRRRDAS